MISALPGQVTTRPSPAAYPPAHRSAVRLRGPIPCRAGVAPGWARRKALELIMARKPEASGHRLEILRSAGPSRPRRYSGAHTHRVLRPITARSGVSHRARRSL